MRLDLFRNPEFDRGASRVKEALWLAVAALVFETWLPGAAWRVAVLRAFGANVGTRVTIKPRVCVKFPWKLRIGHHCWIGERVWIDNVAAVDLGDHVCVSQGAYLCTGNHDWADPAFELRDRPISVGSHAWLGAMSTLAPGVSVGEGAVLGLGSTAHGDLAAWSINVGNPAAAVKARVLSEVRT